MAKYAVLTEKNQIAKVVDASLQTVEIHDPRTKGEYHMSMRRIIFFSGIILASLPFFAIAQTWTPCNSFQSGSAPPTGYGAAWNVLSPGRELLVSAVCDYSEEMSIATVGTGAANQAVYKVRYYYSPTKSQWVSTELQGTFMQGSTDWIAGKGTIKGGGALVNPLHWVGYVCQWTGTAWKCGCRDEACTQNFWQLQGVVNPFLDAGTGGGGTTGGASGGTTGGTTGAGTPSGGDKLPAAARTVNVANGSQLSSAISNAQAGDRIVLASGSYGGFTVERSGANGKPIVIISPTPRGAKVGGTITINGNYVWVIGMDMGGHNINIFGSHDRVSRNYLGARTGPGIFAQKPSRNAEIDHSELTGFITVPDNASAIGSSPIFSRHQCSSPANHYIHHNYIHDSNGGGKNGNSEAIMSGFGVSCGKDTHFAPLANTLIEYNLIQNYGAGYCLRTKSATNTFRFNTCINTDSIQDRWGIDNHWIANWVEDAGNMLIFDHGSKVIGNVLIGTTLRIGAGNLNDASDYEAGYYAADDALVVGNSGPLTIGYFWGDEKAPAFKVLNVRVEAHKTGNGCGQGTITCVYGNTATFSATTQHQVPQAIRLTPSQVGPNAPTAPKP
jgi:hypothetical protein